MNTTIDIEQLEKDSARWRYFADCAQTALLLGSELNPNENHDWLLESNRLADSLMQENETK